MSRCSVLLTKPAHLLSHDEMLANWASFQKGPKIVFVQVAPDSTWRDTEQSLGIVECLFPISPSSSLLRGEVPKMRWALSQRSRLSSLIDTQIIIQTRVRLDHQTSVGPEYFTDLSTWMHNMSRKEPTNYRTSSMAAVRFSCRACLYLKFLAISNIRPVLSTTWQIKPYWENIPI